MTPDDATAVPRQTAGPWLAGQALQRPGEIGTVMRLMAEGGRSNDACLHARQYLEHALGTGPAARLTSVDYRAAAGILHGSSSSLALGDVMEAMAETDGELRATAPAWLARYANRPETQPERQAASQLKSGEVRESGQAARGLDGAWYTRAWYPRSGKPAVVVTSSALSEEIVNFANAGDAHSWLESRFLTATGPLPTTATGPHSRTAREEELLAFIVRDPRAGAGIAALARPDTWTTHLRAELFTAWRQATATGGTPGYGVIASAYTRRLLRAPAAAAEDIGWPGATRAIAYLQRLATTQVSLAQAGAAAVALAETDRTARSPRALPGAAPALSSQRQVEARQPLQAPPPPTPGHRAAAPRL